MQIDIGEVRFLTKVAQKSPRGLRLLLFKEKSSGNEKLVFIVKTASEDIDKLALSSTDSTEVFAGSANQPMHVSQNLIFRVKLLIPSIDVDGHNVIAAFPVDGQYLVYDAQRNQPGFRAPRPTAV